MTAMVTAVETGNDITNGTNFVSPSTIPNEISETGSPATLLLVLCHMKMDLINYQLKILNI